MTSVMDGQSSLREFDLSSAPQISPRNPALVRVISLVSAVAIVGLAAGSVIYNEFTGVVRGVPSPNRLFVIGAAALIGGMFLTLYFGMGPGAVRCDWEADKFTLEYGSGRSRVFRWNDPALRLDIGETSFRGKIEYNLATRMPFHNKLTVELYKAIVAEAQRRGLEVRTRVSEVGTMRTVTSRIRGKIEVRP